MRRVHSGHDRRYAIDFSKLRRGLSCAQRVTFDIHGDIVEGVVHVMGWAPGRFRYESATMSTTSATPSPFSCSSSLTSYNAYSWGSCPRRFRFRRPQESCPLRPGDVTEACTDCSELERDFGYKDATLFEIGLRVFAKWHRGCCGSGGVTARREVYDEC